MTNTIRVKICGLSTPETVAAAVEAGAAYVGFVFYGPSPRNVDVAKARDLAIEVPPGVAKVALTVDADDAFLDLLAETVPIDILQLHGGETPQRVQTVRERLGLPVMKAVGLADASDLPAISDYASVADQILVDAKPSTSGTLPGGNGVAFDWRLVANRDWEIPWMLAGGLTPENVSQAVSLTRAKQIDVSSGVESSPGVKDPDLIRAFLRAVS